MNGTRALGIALIIIGVIGVAVGIVYFTVPVSKLPSFMGHVVHTKRALHAHRTKRGLAGVVVGGILLIVGIVVARPRPATEEE